MANEDYERRPAIDFNKLREAISTNQDADVADVSKLPPPHQQLTPSSEVTRFAPPRERAVANVAREQSQPKQTALQNIARSILALPWREGEAMGKAIDSKKADNKSTIAAMMDWAFEWQTFKEEEPPKTE